MHHRVMGLGSIFMVTVVIGCGGGGSGSGMPTNLPANTKLVTLTPAQETQLCADLGNYWLHEIPAASACKYTGIVAASRLSSDSTVTDAALQSACSQAVADCISGTPDTASICSYTGSTCSSDVTVGDVNACITAEVDAERALFGALPACSAVTRTWLSLNGTGGTYLEPASCHSLQAKCSSGVDI